MTWASVSSKKLNPRRTWWLFALVFASILVNTLVTATVESGVTMPPHGGSESHIANENGSFSMPQVNEKTVQISRRAAIMQLTLRRLTASIGDGRFEMAGIALLVIAIVQMYRGKTKNFQIAQKWGSLSQSLVSSSFKIAGFESSFLRAYGWNSFEYFATGHPHCSYFLAKLECHARACLWRYLYGWIFGFTDTLEIEAGIPTMDRYSLLIGRRVSLRALQDSYPTVGETTSQRKLPGASAALAILTDANEVAEKLLSAEVLATLNSNANRLGHLIVSDITPSQRYSDINPTAGLGGNKLLRLQIKLPPLTQGKEIISLIQLTLRLIETAGVFRLTDKAKQKVKKAREPLEKKKEQEELENQREALRKKKEEEHNELIRKMTPKMREELQEKREKKQQRHRLKRLKVVKAA